MSTETLRSPIGPIIITVNDGSLIRLKFAPTDEPVTDEETTAAGAALRAYFSGDVYALDPLRVVTEGSRFQQRVWSALRTIPVGETASYADIAVEIGQPRAVRAVGRANATNPVGLVVPCHRVIRSDGTLGGYGGGLDRKRWLLDHEYRCAGNRASTLVRRCGVDPPWWTP
jgi:methylated-DNA-[protein]-cysteine S-methyltransferase